MCTLVLHTVVDDFSLENIFIRLSIRWTGRRLKISNYLKVTRRNLYRMTNIAITSPRIINTHAPTIPSTNIGRLLDDEDSNAILYKVSKKMLITVLIFWFKIVCMFMIRILVFKCLKSVLFLFTHIILYVFNKTYSFLNDNQSIHESKCRIYFIYIATLYLSGL